MVSRTAATAFACGAHRPLLTATLTPSRASSPLLWTHRSPSAPSSLQVPQLIIESEGPCKILLANHAWCALTGYLRLPTTASSSSSASASTAVPPRIGFAPLAGCDFVAAAAEVLPASSLAVPAASELGHDPAKAPEALPTQAIEDWGSLGRSGGGDRVEPRGAPPRP